MPESSRLEAMRIWRELEARLESRRIVCSAIWTETWLNHFGQTMPHQFAVARRDDQVSGICLLTRGADERNGPVPIRTWHVGTSGEPDADSACVEYNSLLVLPSDRREFQQALWKWVSSRNDWDEFRLDGLCEEELDGWLSCDSNWVIRSKATNYFDCVAARESDTTTIDALGPETRALIRKNLRRAGLIKRQWAETVTDARDIFDELVALHQARWNAVGQPGCYSSRVFYEFHLELLSRLVPLQLMGLLRVSNENGTIGCSQTLIDNNRACMYQGGRALTFDGLSSPGVILDFQVIEECRLRGFDQVDFLAGDSPHKRRLSTHNSSMIWAVCRRPSFKNRLLDGLRSVKHAFLRTFGGPLPCGPQIPSNAIVADNSVS